MTILYIATPLYGGQACVTYARSLLKLVQYLREHGIAVMVDLVGNESLIQRARNLMAARFYRSEATHLMFIDGDIGFEPEEVMRLLTSGLPLVTGVYPKKHIAWEKLSKLDRGSRETLKTVGLDYNLNIELTKLTKINKGFIQSLDAATGFMLIHRDVYRAVYDAHPELECLNDVMSNGTIQRESYRAVFECMICPDSKRYLSEDFSFVRRCQAQGIEVWCDIKSKLTHTGSITVDYPTLAKCARDCDPSGGQCPMPSSS